MFDALRVKNQCVEWIRDFFDKNGKDCIAVIGISGGKDSSVVAGLAVEALGKDRVLGVLMPCGEQSDIDFSYKLVELLKIKSVVINIKDAKSSIESQIDGQIPLSTQSKINLSPRLRMSAVYAVSQSVNGRVANTSNLSERYVGYSTRYGDSVGDFSPLANLTATEVVAIGKYLGLGDELCDKKPADGLSGKTDEDNLGFTYFALDKYIRQGEGDEELIAKIERLHKINAFKQQPMPSFPFEIE